MILFTIVAVVFCMLALEMSLVSVQENSSPIIKVPKWLSIENNEFISPSQMFLISFVAIVILTRIGIVRSNEQLFTTSFPLYLYLLIGAIGTCYNTILYGKIGNVYVYCGLILGIGINIMLLLTNTIQTYETLIVGLFGALIYLIVSLFLKDVLQDTLKELLGFVVLLSSVFSLIGIRNFLIVTLVVLIIEYVVRKLIMYVKTKQFKLNHKLTLGVSLSISLWITLLVYISALHFMS